MIGELPPPTSKATVFLDLDNVDRITQEHARSQLSNSPYLADSDIVNSAFNELCRKRTKLRRNGSAALKFSADVVTRLASWCDRSFDLGSQNRLAYANRSTERNVPGGILVERLDWQVSVVPNHKDEVDHRIERDLAGRLTGDWRSECVVIISQDMKLHRRIKKVAKDSGYVACMVAVTVCDSRSNKKETIKHQFRPNSEAGSFYDAVITLVEALRSDFREEKADKNPIGQGSFASYRTGLTNGLIPSKADVVKRRRVAIAEKIALPGREADDYVIARLDAMDDIESLGREAATLLRALERLEALPHGQKTPVFKVDALRVTIVKEFEDRRNRFSGKRNLTASLPELDVSNEIAGQRDLPSLKGAQGCEPYDLR